MTEEHGESGRTDGRGRRPSKCGRTSLLSRLHPPSLLAWSLRMTLKGHMTDGRSRRRNSESKSAVLGLKATARFTVSIEMRGIFTPHSSRMHCRHVKQRWDPYVRRHSAAPFERARAGTQTILHGEMEERRREDSNIQMPRHLIALSSLVLCTSFFLVERRGLTSAGPKWRPLCGPFWSLDLSPNYSHCRELVGRDNQGTK